MTLHSQRFATETLIQLSNKIPSIEIIMEYSVKPYRIDAYLPQHNIAIEIDENDHVFYEKEKEVERSRFITQQLRCSWIRVDNQLSQQETVCYLLKQLSYYGITEEDKAEQKVLPLLSEPPQKTFRQQLKELKEQEAEEKARKEVESIKLKQEYQKSGLEKAQVIVEKYFERSEEIVLTSSEIKNAISEYCIESKTTDDKQYLISIVKEWFTREAGEPVKGRTSMGTRVLGFVGWTVKKHSIDAQKIICMKIFNLLELEFDDIKKEYKIPNGCRTLEDLVKSEYKNGNTFFQPVQIQNLKSSYVAICSVLGSVDFEARARYNGRCCFMTGSQGKDRCRNFYLSPKIQNFICKITTDYYNHI